MNNIYLLYNFNSYHNRVLKKFDTLTEYLNYQTSENNQYDMITNANFDYKDGVVANCTYNLGSGFEYDNSPNYALVVDTNSNIKSRWYVVDGIKTRGGQYLLTLLRDGIADYKDEILYAPCYIEKATLGSGNPLIFNSENISVNQIKTSETLLKDPSRCAWVVGYLAPDTTATTISSNEAVEIDGAFVDASAFGTYLQNMGIKNYCATDESDLSDSGIGSSPQSTDSRVYQFQISYICRAPAYINSTATASIGYNALRFYFNTNSSSVSGESINGPGSSVANVNANTGLDYYAYDVSVNLFKGWTSVINNFRDNISSRTSSLQSSILSYTGHTDSYQTIGNFQSKKYKVGNEYYELTLNTSSTSWNLVGRFGTNQTGYSFISSLNDMGEVSEVNSVSSDAIAIQEHMRNAYISITKISSSELSFDLTGGERVCGTLPYKMFAIPYSREKNITVRYGTSSSYTTINMAKELALSIGKAISAKYSGANALYDLQLLPYCPAQNIIVTDHTILVPSNNTQTTLVKKNNTDIGVIYWCADNQGTFNINHSISITNTKLESITDMYRLSSPNWNGQFEFNASKNGGVSQFNVDFTYKPHMPYIHINPNFGRLYGQDFDDARGLICQGDFSLPQTSEAWNTYELQNKNYQTQFNRQIDNMEVMHKYDMTELGAKGIAGIFTGAASGATTGAVMGGGLPGAIAGGLLGGAMSAIGSAVDQKIAQGRYAETLDYTKDLFDLQLDNIKALPSNLTNVGAMTYNNKLFPVLEFYTCTDEEKEAITLKLYYNGMTVDTIGNIGDYILEEPSYIKGKIIRLNINEDNHLVEHITEEINKGVFI